MTPEEKISPCPFCGATAKIAEIPSSLDGVVFSVECDSDSEADCMGYQSFTVFNTRREAVVAWNKRDNHHVRTSAEWKATCLVLDAVRRAELKGYDATRVSAIRDALAELDRVRGEGK